MIELLSAALDRAAEMLSNPRSIHRIVISGRRRGKQPEFERIDIRPVELKGQLHFQATSHDGRRDTTKNYLPHDLSLAALMNLGFGNLLIETTDEEMNLRITKSGDAQVNVKARSQKLDSIDLSHDRKKARYLTEDELIFRELGISDHNGKLKASRSDKFIQVNEFLKIIDHAVSELERDSNSRERNEKIAKRAYLSQEITFIAEEIDSYPPHAVDITVALHACDTATDDAISWAVESKSQVILVAPCCHHDIQKQIKKAPEPWGIATKHGILKERIGDIVTDAIRAQVLRVLGYRTDVIEFVAGDHTPRNLMIRAIYTGASAQQHDFDELDALIQQWGIEPALLSRLDAAIAAQRKSALG